VDQFKLLEHTADIGIEATAGCREQLAAQTGLGLRLLLYGDAYADPLLAEEIHADGQTAAETLVNWLNELLFVLTEKQLVPAGIDITSFNENRIVATVSGEHFDPEKHQALREIKAVTHHQARVFHENRHWKATVFLDL